ncbi:pupal cuticle protein-like [Periplaneta americana]|uniref:pupal cuticle protein-like n=1 Tax=Periplaneta americana TaxID=6978 RepID=UPI0037E8B692
MEIHRFAAVSALLLAFTVAATAQHQQSYEPQPYAQPQRPLPAIIMHKQALSQDGAFNYAFAADNGLQQGESISPDGTRRGSYSYVDPNGKKISVKYTAGKDGFRILEGDHLPRAPAPVAAAPAPVHSAAPQNGFIPRASPYVAGSPYTSSYQSANTNAIYRGQASPYYKVQDDYEKGAGSQQAYKSVYQSTAPATFPGGEQRRPRPIIAQPSAQYSNGQPDAEGRQEPHSFGSGYAFEFAG